MTDDLLEEFTRQYIAAQRVPEATFIWQGGEPTLMGLAFFELAVALQKKYRRPGMRVNNALQTNGILLDDDWCRFFKEHDFLVGVSLDGPQALHDVYRVDRRGQPTFRRVMDGLALLKRHKVAFNVLTAVHSANTDHPLEVYRFLRDEVETEFVQFIPIVEPDSRAELQEGKTVTARSVTGGQYGDFLITVFDEWLSRDIGQVYVQIFDVALGAWLGQSSSLCVFRPTCGKALAMEHNGDLYTCDHFIESENRLGNIRQKQLTEMVGSEQQRQFALAKRETLPRYCQQCEVRFVCHGGCPKNRISYSPDGEPGLNYLCDSYRSFFDHVDRPMREMAARILARQAR